VQYDTIAFVIGLSLGLVLRLHRAYSRSRKTVITGDHRRDTLNLINPAVEIGGDVSRRHAVDHSCATRGVEIVPDLLQRSLRKLAIERLLHVTLNRYL
jgi:hypothetical protein